jgi:nitrogen fixation protein NifU and related proteins
MSAATDDLYQELVLEHKRAPRHFAALPAPTHQARGRNPSCGDDVQVQLRVADGHVADVGFTGQGCAICISSASMMTEAVLGRDLDTVRELQQRFRSVLTGQAEPEGAELGKLVSLAGVRRYPARIKCALLGWHALMHALADGAEASGETTTEDSAA